MTKTNLFTIAFIPVILFLGWMLVNGIKSKIDFAKELERSEQSVIAKLKMIRKAQSQFLLSNGQYTTNWDSLTDFIVNGTVVNVQKREIIIPRRSDDPLFYRGDSVRVEYDTLGTLSVQEFLFPDSAYANFDASQIRYAPSGEKEFEIYVGKIVKGGVPVNVIEVVDPIPADKTRDDGHALRKRWRLRFGSKTDAGIAGNWEDI